jgi:hypothetical protein
LTWIHRYDYRIIRIIINWSKCWSRSHK